jgi:hypothetical protein
MTIKGDIYLVARYLKVPKFKGMTSQKNFGQNEDNWQWNEEVNFKQKISDKDFESAGVILGLYKKQIIRNSMNPNASYAALYNYFYEHGYKKQLDEVKNAELMVQNAVNEALAKYKEEGESSAEAWKFPKAEDFEITNDHPKVVYNTDPPNSDSINTPKDELAEKSNG